MTWMKVDDNLHAHRKPKKAGVPAMGLWVLAGSWCADMLTDGFIPDYIAASLDPAYEEHAAALVRSGLWEAAEQDGDEGWHFIGWDEYQPTRADVENKREQARERMARVRGNSSTSARDVRANKERSAETVPPTPSLPVPSRPDPTTSPKPEKEEKPVRPEVEALCNLLADRVEANGARRPNITKAWRDDARLLMDQGNYTPEQVAYVINWATSDDFWSTNILSMKSLRGQFEKLKLKAIAEKKQPVSKTQQEIDDWLAKPLGAPSFGSSPYLEVTQ